MITNEEITKEMVNYFNNFSDFFKLVSDLNNDNYTYKRLNDRLSAQVSDLRDEVYSLKKENDELKDKYNKLEDALCELADRDIEDYTALLDEVIKLKDERNKDAFDKDNYD